MATEIQTTAGNKAKLINAAVGLMAAKGYKSAGINEILEMAKVAKSNFYYHFKSKEEVCLAALDKITNVYFTTVVNQTLANAAMKPRERINSYFDYMIESMESKGCDVGCVFTNLAAETSDFYPAFREKIESIDNRIINVIENTYRDGIKAAEFRKDIDPEIVAGMILSCFKGTMVLSKARKTSDVIRQNRTALFEVIASQNA